MYSLVLFGALVVLREAEKQRRERKYDSKRTRDEEGASVT